MSIRQATFDLCKAISDLPKQVEIRDALLSLNNTQLEYVAERQNAQVYGYLLLDHEHLELAKPPMNLKIDPLTDDIRDKLSRYQAEVFEINRRCVKPLIDFPTNCNERVLTPYNRLKTVKIETFKTFDYFPEDGVTKLVEAFQKHPLLQLAIDTSCIFGPTFSPEHYVQELRQIENMVQGEAIDKLPSQLNQLIYFTSPTSTEWLRIQHMSAVLGLRGSLGIINQLLYSKLFLKQLFSFDSDDIVKFGVYAFATGGSKLLFQQNGLKIILKPGDIVVVKDVPPDHAERYFCLIERLNVNFMPGQVCSAEFRTLDQHLNPYGILFEPFTKHL